MKVLVWDSASKDLENFLELAKKFADIELFDSMEGLEGQAEEQDLLVFDLDADRKGAEKAVKRIKKRLKNVNVVYLCSAMDPKALGKHQKSKVGGDVYLRFPMKEKLFAGLMSGFFQPVDPPPLPSMDAPAQEQEEMEESAALGAELFEEETDMSLKSNDEMSKDEGNEKLENEELDLDLGVEGTEEGLSLSDPESKQDDEDELSLSLDEEAEDLDLSSSEEAESEDLSLDGAEQEANDLDADSGALELSTEDSQELSLDSYEEPAAAPEQDAPEQDAQEEGLDLGVGEDSALELDAGPEEAVDQDAHEEENALELSTEESADDNELEPRELESQDLKPEAQDDSEELQLSAEVEESEDQDSGDLMSNEELFGEAEEPSSRSLPESPELSASSAAAKAGESSMSEHALRKLAEIEEMMRNDASGGGLNAPEDISSPDLPADYSLAGQKMDLADQVGMEDEEPDFDPTKDMEETGIMENPLAVKGEDLQEAEQAFEEFQSDNEEPSFTARDHYASQDEATVRDQKDVLARNDEEFARLGETIKRLREDREALVETVSKLEEKIENEKRDFTSVEAELEEKKIELSLLQKRRSKQVEEMNYRLELSEEKRMILEEKMKRVEKENETLRQKANVDVNRIKARERELENKLELLKADTETQIKNRDMKILELKRKIDTLEFDMESIQTQEKKSVDTKYQMEERMDRVINTLRRAIGELEDEDASIRDIEKIKKNLDV